MTGRLPTVCILAGGRGTRLGARVADRPKPLLEVAGEPFLFHQLRLVAEHGARHAVLCVGYLGELIEACVGAQRYGITIDYSYDSPELGGTLGAIRRALPFLGERFLVLYGDGRVLAYNKRSPTADMCWIDYGLGGLCADAVTRGESDLAALYQELAARGDLCGYEVTERFYEIGTPDALVETEAFLRGEAIASRIAGA